MRNSQEKALQAEGGGGDFLRSVKRVCVTGVSARRVAQCEKTPEETRFRSERILNDMVRRLDFIPISY